MTRATAGFTLVELLVTITLLSLLVVLLFGGLRFGARAWDGAEAHGARTDELRVVQNLLRRELEQAYPAYDTTDPVHPIVQFDGDSDALTFLAPPPQAAQPNGRARITIAAARIGTETQLVMRAQPELATAGAWSAPLLRHIAGVAFSYYGAGGWTPTWSGHATLPSLIRVHVAFRHGDGRVWPDLIVAPQIAADASCIYDVATRRCAGRS
jgi:general secretion pathway protein J